MRAGFDARLAIHMGKILECGGAAAYPRHGSDSLLGVMDQDSFTVEPPNPDKVCTVASVAAHSLYERSDPYRLALPGGAIDLAATTFEQVTPRAVRVSGTRFVGAAPYTFKLEGVRRAGYRTITVAGMRDPMLISQLDAYLENVRTRVAETYHRRLSPALPRLRPRWRDGPLEPAKEIRSHELGLVIEVVADDPETSAAILALSRSAALHVDLPGAQGHRGQPRVPVLAVRPPGGRGVRVQGPSPGRGGRPARAVPRGADRGLRPRRGLAGIALGLVAGGWLMGCSMWIDQLTFFPDRNVGAPPPGAEEWWIATEDGERLHAWSVDARDGAPTLLWSHGNAGNIDTRREIFEALVRRGLGVLAYDYRGYGKSSGSPGEAGVYLDASAAFDSEAALGRDPGGIVCFGESLGGAVSIELATRRRCAAVIAVATFTSLAEVARMHYGALGRLAGDRFNSLERIERLSVPVLVVHGDADEIVPFALGQRLFAAAPEPKRFHRVAGAAHNDVLGRPDVLDVVTSFAREATARRRTPP